MFAAGFRPFFLLAAAWAAIAVPIWLAAYVHGYAPRSSLPALFWRCLRSSGTATRWCSASGWPRWPAFC
jgi:hypothetical protein